MKFLILCAAVLLSLETVSLSQDSSVVREIKNEFEKFDASQDTKWKQILTFIDCRLNQIQNMFDPNKQRINETNLTNVLDACEVEFELNNTLNLCVDDCSRLLIGDAFTAGECPRGDLDCPKNSACRSDRNGVSKCVNLCDTNPCGPHALCSVANHTVLCKCPEIGFYSGDPYERQTGCQKLNCLHDNDCLKDRQCVDFICENACDHVDCGPHGTCVIRDRQAVCRCERGFENNARLLCVDVDECRLHPCHSTALCNNVAGSFSCKCPDSTVGNAYSHPGCHESDVWVNCSNFNQCSKIHISTIHSKLPPIITRQSPLTKHYFYANQYSTETQRSYTMTCEATGYPKPTFRWSKNGITLNIDDYDDRITASNNSGTIVYKQLLDDDEGVYQCFANNQYGTAVSNTVYLRRIIVVSNAHNDPLKVVNAKLGHPLTLDCDVPFGDPKPKAVWFALSSSGDFTTIDTNNSRLAVDPNGRLHFSNISRADIYLPNYYYAVLYYDNNYQYRDGRLFKIKVDSSDSASENNTSYPITLQYASPPNITAQRGTYLDLYCIFGGTPLPKVSWYKKSGTGWLKLGYPPRRGWYIDSNYDKLLTVFTHDYDSSGTYKCVAENGVSAKQSHVIELTEESVPHWTTKTSNNINATEGQTVTLQCYASAKPKPALQWYMNGIPIEKLVSNPRRSVSGSVMRIQNVSETLDTGVYQCNASNIHGYAFKNFYLNVFAPNLSIK